MASLVATIRATDLVLQENNGNEELVTCMAVAIALAILGRQAMKREDQRSEQGLHSFVQ